MTFINSFQSEWIKKRKSAASWLVIIGGLFIPLIILVARLIRSKNLAAENLSPDLWESLSHLCWQFMAVFFLPMGLILAASLITQLEFKNNTWKQLHTTPQSLTTIFLAKLSVILVMMFQFFILFNIGIYLNGVVPSLVYTDVHYPVQSIPWLFLFKTNLKYFIDCLPIVALQYLIGLQFRNFLVPVGAGLTLLVTTMIILRWEHSYTLPYTYSTLTFIASEKNLPTPVNIHLWAIGYFLVFTTAAYVLYIRKREIG